MKEFIVTSTKDSPSWFCRNNSTKDLEAFAGDAVAVNRMVLQHLTINEPIIKYHGRSVEPVRHVDGSSSFELEQGGAQAGIVINIPKISPPGQSKLARRRAERFLRNCRSEDQSPPFTLVMSASPVKGAQ